tara:strand:- start:21 stop:716 length:696 start_codon:yes stop_codon:yes gene_type:complete
MYSRVFTNEGELYKETPLILNEPYVFYEHEGETYLTKPGKVYVEPWHPEFNYYLQNYDTATLGTIVVIGVQQNGDVEIYFDNPDQMDAIATHYSLTKPFASDVIKFKDDSLMSIRFNPDKEAYMYKGYTTRNDSNLTPVATMYIDELDDTLWVYHEDDESAFNGVKKHMFLEKDTSAVVETKPGPFEDNKITIDGVLYYPSDYDYVEHNGYSDTTLQGDPWTNSNVTKLHE